VLDFDFGTGAIPEVWISLLILWGMLITADFTSISDFRATKCGFLNKKDYSLDFGQFVGLLYFRAPSIQVCTVLLKLRRLLFWIRT